MADDELTRALLRKREELTERFNMVKQDYLQKVAAINLLLGEDAFDDLGSNVSSDQDDDPDPDDDGRTTREHIRAILENGGAMRMVDVVSDVKAGAPHASPDTIRSVLQKMARSGEVEKVDRGTYQLARRTPSLTPEISDEPAEEVD
jgi:hypothetical protein